MKATLQPGATIKRRERSEFNGQGIPRDVNGAREGWYRCASDEGRAEAGNHGAPSITAIYTRTLPFVRLTLSRLNAAGFPIIRVAQIIPRVSIPRGAFLASRIQR